MEKSFYKKLSLIGRRLGIRVFVFSPRDVDLEDRTIIGYEFVKGIWQREVFPLPQMIYDRCFIGPTTRLYKSTIEKLQNDPAITFLGRGLSGKWEVHQILEKCPELTRWLPETRPFSMACLTDLLHEHGAAIVKPAAGTHGIGVMLIQREVDCYTVVGRNRENQPFHKRFRSVKALERYMTAVAASRRYLVQQYLELHTPDGTPFDVRVLVQKNGDGQWQTTGMAVRLGSKESITSNLHGGGKAVPLHPFLKTHFPLHKRSQIETELDKMLEILPGFLEENHGRLVELGIDVGIDRGGNVWIIEVNSRPGRNVFRQIEDQKARLHSIAQPVRYANYLMKERLQNRRTIASK